MMRAPMLMAAFAWLALVALLAALAPALAPFDPTDQMILDRLKPPGFAGEAGRFLLGTDHLGRDVFSRCLHGLRISIAVAIMGATLSALIGISIGLVAGHFRGLVEDVLMGLTDIGLAVPFVIVALTALAFFGNSFPLFVVLMGLAGWEKFARLTRGLVLDAKTRPYVEALAAAGAGAGRIYGRHVVPNMLAALMVQFSLNLPEVILLETGLSFLGLGIQPPLASLGLMLSEGRDYLATAWWIAVFPGLVIFLTTLAISLIGDALRDRLDPTLR